MLFNCILAAIGIMPIQSEGADVSSVYSDWMAMETFEFNLFSVLTGINGKMWKSKGFICMFMFTSQVACFLGSFQLDSTMSCITQAPRISDGL